MMKAYSTFFFLLIKLSFSYAQENSIIKSVQSKLDHYNDYYQPEYATLHLDKDFYFTGDKLWYSLFLWNETNTPGSLSNIAYVELRDGRDSILIRQKIRSGSGKGHGEFTLPEALPTGYYKIVAITAWMKNNIVSNRFEKLVPVINPDNILTKELVPMVQENKSLFTIKKDSDIITVEVPPGTSGGIIALNVGEVIAHQSLTESNSLKLILDDPLDHLINIVLIDDDGKVVEEKEIVSDNITSTILITPVVKLLSPGAEGELLIGLNDKSGKPVRGEVSISIRPEEVIGIDTPPPHPVFSYETMDKADFSMLFRKETFVHPVSLNTAPSIAFSSGVAPMPFQFPVVGSGYQKLLVKADLKRNIMVTYGVNAIYDIDEEYNLKSNNTFLLNRYVSLPNMTEFIREVVPQIKVKKMDGQKTILLRNMDNPENLYFFRNPPLILIDRFMATVEEFFDLPLADIDRIDVIWSTKDINALGIFSLADNGVVSVITKSRIKYAQSRIEIFNGLHFPLKFSIPKFNEKDNKIPVLADPLFWNPSLIINGKAKVKFDTSDELGWFVVEVRGMTESGDHISGTVNIKVGAD